MFIVCLFVLLFLYPTESYKILGISPLPCMGHFVMFERLFKGLAERGHEVDVVSHFPQKTPLSGYNDLSILGSMPLEVNYLSVSKVEKLSLLSDILYIFSESGTDVCKAMLNATAVKNLKNTTKKYDLLITELFGSDCSLGFGHYFKIPVVALTTSVMLPWGNDRIGNPDNPSYIPTYFSPFSGKMTLLERILNVLVLVGSKVGYDQISMTNSNALLKQFFGPDVPDLRELIYNTSLVMVNSHFSINQARSLVPNFIEVGGLHIGDLKPLPEHLKNFVENSTGIIYLSMGSMVLSETFGKEKLQGIFDAFAEFPYKVLWKASKENIPKELTLPKNIHFEKWMPQVDVLCNPKVLLFVTHGGLMGSQEAFKCGVPRLGIPFFADQEYNIKQAVAAGVAIKVPYKNITKYSIFEAARELLYNEKYKKNAEKLSKLFLDRQSSPLETAIYWIEYVIRHKGAAHLQSDAAFLPWYQYYLVDVVLVLLGIVLLLTGFSYLFIKKCVTVLIGMFRIKSKTD